MSDLGTSLRDLIDGSLPEFDFDTVVARRRLRKQRRRRKGAIVAAVAVVALVGGIAAVTANDHHDVKSVHVQATTPSTLVRPTISPTDGLVPVTTPDGPSAALSPLLSLPACPDDGGFVDWARGALSPYDATAVPSSAPLAHEPLRDVGAYTALVQQASPTGCVVAGQVGKAVGWEVRNAAGAVVVRAVSIPGNGVVPQRMLDHVSTYHQESIASGQYFSGYVAGDAAEAVINARITVMSVVGLAASSYDDGVALEHRLYLARAQTKTDDSFALPTRMVSGLKLCAVPADYCDSAGRSVSIDSAASFPAVGSHLTINGQAAIATQDRSGTRHVAVKLPYPGYTLGATGTGVTTNQLVSVLRSVPLLTDAYLHPASGTRDLRASFNEGWLRRQLASIGARDITITAENPGGEGSAPSADRFEHAAFTATDGTRANGTFGAQAPLRQPAASRVVTLGTVQFQTDDRQTYGYCNDIFVNIVSPNSATIAGAVVRQLGC